MKILVNCSILNSTGTLQVGLSFINECKLRHEHEYHILVGPAMSKIINIYTYPSNFHFYKIEKRISSNIINFYIVRRHLNKLENTIRPDIVFSVFGPSYWRPKVKHVQGFATPHVLYKDSPFFEIISWKRRLWWQVHRQIQLILLRYESTEIILETEAMQKRLLKYIQTKKTHIVSNTCSEVFLSHKSIKKREIAEDGTYKLLTLCSYKRHKNLEIIAKVIDELWSMKIMNVQFFVTLPDSQYNLLFDKKYASVIINLGLLHPNDCPDAYSKIDFMFLPTLLESFSASYPEAMCMQKPILTSNYDFATDICGDAAIYFDALNPRSIANTIAKLIYNPELRNSLIMRGMSRLKKFGSSDDRCSCYLNILTDKYD